MKRIELKVARIEKDLKQIDVANYLGINQARYSRIETGIGKPTIHQMFKLAKLLDLDLSVFTGVKRSKMSESKLGEKNTTFIHGYSDTKIYAVWNALKSRCNSPKNKEYKHYGERGIKVCPEWLTDFMNFRNWAITNGYEEHLQIDRINNDGNYEPSNCRFVTPTQNGNNRRNNHVVEYKGETFTVSELARKYNIDNQLLRSRIRSGWDIERALIPMKYISKKGVGIWTKS